MLSENATAGEHNLFVNVQELFIAYWRCSEAVKLPASWI
jgi:hypothetical protein